MGLFDRIFTPYVSQQRRRLEDMGDRSRIIMQ